MASIAIKNGAYHVRFLFAGRHFRRSLHTRDPRQAEVLLFAIRATLGRIELGQLVVPIGVDPGDFIASAGMRTTPATNSTPRVPLLRTLIDEFHATRFTVARSTAYTERIHLKHFATGLGTKLDQPSDQITQRDLDRHLFSRSRSVAADTVAKERATILQLFRWAVEQGYLALSPALKLAKVKGAADRAPFRTQAEIQAVIARGGLEDAEVEGLWRSLYLSPDEVAELLQLVTNRASQDFAPLLHGRSVFQDTQKTK
ncbi:MAG: hypothetical protein JNM18_19175 [Planctomycetaceae bacterium]|nr:hypothetical protein [Planctomycetaceae bacterium]